MGFVPYSTPLGESPPPPPRACFGRSELIEKIVGLAENLTPIALVGTGGIGKTSIALTVLHHDRIKERFGVNRRFIRCDRFPASCSHFLSRLSKVVGAGVINPEDLTPLRPFLSSMEMIIFLENAESILDPRGSNAQEIYAVVEELIQFRNICLCITSRISTIPPSCETLEIPTLPPMAARNAFHGIYKHDGQSNLVDGILRQLDFHPLSITLLATVAHHSKWDSDRLVSEWGRRRTDVLHTQHNESLAATIELSLSSPMFQELGPDARDLLGVIAFFPNGINENNIDWLFPTLPNRMTIFDNFCILSLTYRSNGFVTMLAPLRDFLSPKDPASSPLLRATKDRYFDRLSVYVDPNHTGFEEAQWIRSEDENVEHLLDVFISIDPGSVEVWDACGRFMRHLYWHKQRLVAFGPKIENLPDTHHSKPQCLFQLSRLFLSVGKPAEYKRLLTHTLKLRRGRGDYFHVAQTLMYISDANEQLTLHEEGIQRAKEALAIYKQFNNTMGQARAWLQLGRLLYFDDQLNAAEGAVSRTIHLLANYPNEFPVCECYRNLGGICQSKGKTEEAVKHFKKALEIASSFGWHDQLFWNSYDLAVLFFHEGRFNDAQAHIERAKLHAINNRYRLGRAMHLQAGLWYKQHRLKESKSEASRAASVFEELGDVKNAGVCRTDLQVIEEKMSRLADFNGERNPRERRYHSLRLVTFHSQLGVSETLTSSFRRISPQILTRTPRPEHARLLTFILPIIFAFLFSQGYPPPCSQCCSLLAHVLSCPAPDLVL